MSSYLLHLIQLFLTIILLLIYEGINLFKHEFYKTRKFTLQSHQYLPKQPDYSIKKILAMWSNQVKSKTTKDIRQMAITIEIFDQC